MSTPPPRAYSFVPTSCFGAISLFHQEIAEPVLLPDKGIWHPVADKVFEDAKEYLDWYNQVRGRTDFVHDLGLFS